MGLSHISFICEDWDAISIQERNYQNQFDFVFAHMTPAIHNTETLVKLQACSKKWCMLVMLWLFAIGYVSVQITGSIRTNCRIRGILDR